VKNFHNSSGKKVSSDAEMSLKKKSNKEKFFWDKERDKIMNLNSAAK